MIFNYTLFVDLIEYSLSPDGKEDFERKKFNIEIIKILDGEKSIFLKDSTLERMSSMRLSLKNKFRYSLRDKKREIKSLLKFTLRGLNQPFFEDCLTRAVLCSDIDTEESRSKILLSRTKEIEEFAFNVLDLAFFQSNTYPAGRNKNAVSKDFFTEMKAIQIKTMEVPKSEFIDDKVDSNSYEATDKKEFNFAVFEENKLSLPNRYKRKISNLFQDYFLSRVLYIGMIILGIPSFIGTRDFESLKISVIAFFIGYFAIVIMDKVYILDKYLSQEEVTIYNLLAAQYENCNKITYKNKEYYKTTKWPTLLSPFLKEQDYESVFFLNHDTAHVLMTQDVLDFILIGKNQYIGCHYCCVIINGEILVKNIEHVIINERVFQKIDYPNSDTISNNGKYRLVDKPYIKSIELTPNSSVYIKERLEESTAIEEFIIICKSKNLKNSSAYYLCLDYGEIRMKKELELCYKNTQ